VVGPGDAHRQHPPPVGREAERAARADAHRRRAVRAAQEGRVARPPPWPLSLEEDRGPVGGDPLHRREVEPRQVPSAASPVRRKRTSERSVARSRSTPPVGGRVVEHEAAHAGEDRAHPPVEGERAERVVRPYFRRRQPHLAAPGAQASPSRLATPASRRRAGRSGRGTTTSPGRPRAWGGTRSPGASRRARAGGGSGGPGSPPGRARSGTRGGSRSPSRGRRRTPWRPRPSRRRPRAFRTSLGGPPAEGGPREDAVVQERDLPRARDTDHRALYLERAEVARVRAATWTTRGPRPRRRVDDLSVRPERAAWTAPRRNVIRWKDGGPAGAGRRRNGHSRPASTARAARPKAARSSHRSTDRAGGVGAGSGDSPAGRGRARPPPAAATRAPPERPSPARPCRRSTGTAPRQGLQVAGVLVCVARAARIWRTQKLSDCSKSTNVPAGHTFGLDLLAGHHLARAAGEEDQHLEGLGLEAHRRAVAPQLAAAHVQLEGPEPQREELSLGLCVQRVDARCIIARPPGPGSPYSL